MRNFPWAGSPRKWRQSHYIRWRSEWVDGILTEARSRPEQVKTEAADFGPQAHIFIEQIIRGLAPEIPPQFVSVVRSFDESRRGAGLDIQLTETMVYSARHHYAGAMDALASREGELVALDRKTSNALYPEYALQVAAYAKAMEEMSGKRVRETWTSIPLPLAHQKSSVGSEDSTSDTAPAYTKLFGRRNRAKDSEKLPN